MNRLELQRLVDGELLPTDRNRLLLQLSNEPMKWREVALAFIEEQEFRRELGNITHLARENGASPIETSTPSVPSAKAQLLDMSHRHFPIRHWLPIALAASLLIGVGFVSGNWLAGTMRKGEIVSSANSNASIAAVNPKESHSGSDDLESLRPVGHLRFTSDLDAAASSPSMQLPIYEAAPEQITQMLQTQQRQIQAWNEQLRQRGYELEWQPEMIESRLPDGRSVIVPVQQVNVRSLGH